MDHERIRILLSRLYGLETAESVFPDLISVLNEHRRRHPSARAGGLSARDAFLITYADQVGEEGKLPLQSLDEFCYGQLKGLVSGIHVLPFFPWSSDDGFSVIDYERVDPRYGTWNEIRRLGEHFRLMMDAVINHASAESDWFKGYQHGERRYAEFFIDVQGNPDLSKVVRPRALPLLTEFRVDGRPRRLWTTFSADQVDLNYANPKVLLRIIEVLLFYVSQGAELIRLDAIAYLWKQPGTQCISLPQAHWVVQLLRAVLDEVAPHVMLITETNVPSSDNLTYFGDGTNEAQLIYNFPLPPLVLHSLQTGNADALARWAAALVLPPGGATFLNFLGSHDGIGLNPVRGILQESEIQALTENVQRGGGFVSAKMNADGTQSAYELNANYFDALDAGYRTVDEALQVKRFLTAHAMLLAFRGVPAIYFHSMFGSRGWPEGVSQTGKNRAINREKLERSKLERELADPRSLRARVFGGLRRMLQVRTEQTAFAPQAPQRVVDSAPGVLAFVRQEDSEEPILCVHSVCAEASSVELGLSNGPLTRAGSLRELISGREFPAGNPLRLRLEPYESVWLKAGDRGA